MLIRITLIRMTDFRFLPTRWLALPALVLALLAGAGYAFEASGQAGRPARVGVAVDPSSGVDAQAIAAARDAVRRAGRGGAEAQLRVTRTATEQLSVTHYF